MKQNSCFYVHCDGGSRGNPGPAATGFVVFDCFRKVVVKEKRFIGRATNNVAEYQAVVEALLWFLKNKKKLSSGSEGKRLMIRFFLDSLLVVNQLNGIYKIKNANLGKLVIKIKGLEKEIGGTFVYCYRARESNKIADGLVNKALDEVGGES